MHVVVNQLHLREPMTATLLESAKAAAQQVVDAGALAAQVVRVDDTHLILLLDFSSQQDADRVSREVGGPWMRDHVLPLLERGPERVVGEVVASARA